MQTLFDFLSFKSFISLDVLLVLYYLGALGMPLLGWVISAWIKTKLHIHKESSQKGKYQTYFMLVFIFIFTLLEVFWRVMFEVLIAYFQMRDVIVGV